MEKSEQQESFTRHRSGKIAVLIDFDLSFRVSSLLESSSGWEMGQLSLNDTAGSHLMQIYMKLTFVGFDFIRSTC